MNILVLNSGSSTQKSALFELASEPPIEPVAPIWEGKLEWDGDKETLTAGNGDGKKLNEEATVPAAERKASLEKLLTKLWRSPTQVIRKEPALDKIVPGGAKIEKLAGGFLFTEGPVWFPSQKRATGISCSAIPTTTRSTVGLRMASFRFT